MNGEETTTGNLGAFAPAGEGGAQEAKDSPSDRRLRGMQKMAEVYGFSVDPASVPGGFVEMTVDHLFGEVWCRPELSIFERRLLTIGALAALGQPSLLQIQFSSALARSELTEAQIREIVVHLTHYVGWPLATGLSDAAEKAISAHRPSQAGSGTAEPGTTRDA